jgi:tetratricopeptide (TPR) repeat protein
LAQDPAPDAAAYLLTGKNHFMLRDYKRAVEYFEKALALSPANSEYELWLGRAWGRRAESSNSPMAVVYANRTRQCFEKAVAMDPHNYEAKNDLFDFYLNAPGLVGGGVERAGAAARSISLERPPEYEFEEAQLAVKRKDYAAVEAHLRRAMQLAPGEAGRVLDLAQWIAKRGRPGESELLFAQARKLEPGQPKIDFAEAKADIENHRNLAHARKLLQGYLSASLTPDDPPREEAGKLLKLAGG